MANEIALSKDFVVLDMWVNAHPDGFKMISSAPKTVSDPLKVLTKSLIPHFIHSTQTEKIRLIVKNWTQKEKEEIALLCASDDASIPLSFNNPLSFNIFAIFSGQNKQDAPVGNLALSEEIASVYPEYFKIRLEKQLNKFIEEKQMQQKMRGLQGFMPPQFFVGLGTHNSATLQIAFQYLSVLPAEWQDRFAHNVQASPYIQDILDASPEFKSFVEKKEINKALKNLPSFENRPRVSRCAPADQVKKRKM